VGGVETICRRDPGAERRRGDREYDGACSSSIRASTPEEPKVARESAKAIWVVAVEVVFGTALARLGDALDPRNRCAISL